jgi:hypothetical protein
MSPESDNWYSTKKAPDIIFTDDGVGQVTTKQTLRSIVNSQSR